MKLTCVILTKEVKSYLKSPWFYLIVGLTSFPTFYIFFERVAFFQNRSLNFMSQGAPMPSLHEVVITPLVGGLHFLLFLSLPALTSRLIAEEKKLKSFDLLMTSPITSSQIVLAKLMAGMWVLLFMLLVSSVGALYLSFFTKFEWGLFASTYLAVFLVGSCYVAVGVFTSAITESMIVAFVMAVVLNFSLWLLALVGQNTNDAVVQAVVNHVAINNHFGNLVRGRVELSALVYMSSVIAFFGFLAQRAVEAMRWR